jgi:DNA ligase 4
LKEIKGSVEFTTDYKGRAAKDIRERMDEVMAARGEGLVIKHPMSKYVLNGRNVDWIKVILAHFLYYEAWLMFFCLR